jgi:hypothetical protein
MSIVEEVQPSDEHRHQADIETTVSYLPAAHPYKHDFARETVLETVRTDAMAFFGVHDRQERDTYRYFLEFHGEKITDTGQTLERFLTEHHLGHEVHFNLVEEITPGAK